MSIPEIAKRLPVGRVAVYTMLEQGIIPAIRLGRRWIVTRHAFENWARTCGVLTGTSSDIRQFYVGATRAREKLYICGRESNIAVTI
jgi:excisionase family DNA binding protein